MPDVPLTPPALTVPPPPAPPIRTTRMEVVIPNGPQPTTTGPYHAVIRGPGGLDVSISGEQYLFGRIVGAVGDLLAFGSAEDE